MRNVVLLDVLALGVFFPDGPDGGRTGVEMVDYITASILFRRSISSQKTSGLGVPTGLPSNTTVLKPTTGGPYMIKEWPRTQPMSLEQNILSPALAL